MTKDEKYSVKYDDDGRRLLVPDVMGLLWRAFSLRGCDDGLTMKAGLARRFKSHMMEAVLWVEQSNGDLLRKPDPRGGLQLANASVTFFPNGPEATYLKECVTELKAKRNQDGSPVINATASDHMEEIEDDLLPLWLKQNDTPVLEQLAAPAPKALAAPVEAHK